MKINKKILIAVSILVLTIIYFTLGSSEEKVSLKKPDKILPVKVLVMDKNKTDESINLDKANDGDIDQILYFTLGEAYLYKNGDSYEADLNNFNDLIFENVTDYIFAKNNDLGQVVNDAKFDKKNKKVIIPVSYFEKSDKDDPIQFEIQCRLTERQIKNTEVNVTVSSFGKKKKTVALNNFDMQTSVSIGSGFGSKSISKSDINVYLNDKKIKLPSDSYDWDSKNGIVTLNSMPLVLDNVYITVNKKNIFSRFLNIKIAKAVSYSKMTTYQTLLSKPNVSTGDVLNYSVNLDYVDATTTDHKDCNFSSSYGDVKWTKKNACTSGWKYMYGYSGGAVSDSYWEKDGGAYTNGSWSSSVQKGSVKDYVTNKGNTSLNTVYTTFLADLSSQSIGGVSFRSKTKSTTVYDEVSDGNGGTTKVYKYNPTWISLMCVHVGSETNVAAPSFSGSNNLQVKVLTINDKYMVLGFKSGLSNSQNGFGIYKFAFADDKKCSWFKVGKDLTDVAFPSEGTAPLIKTYNHNKVAGIKFRVWDELSACQSNNKKSEAFVDEVTTDSNGVAYVTELGVDDSEGADNTYYVREVNTPSGYNLNNHCYPVVPTRRQSCAENGIGGILDNNYPYTVDLAVPQYPKKYCLNITKKEANTNNTLTGGTFTFELVGSNGVSYGTKSTTNGSLTFENLDNLSYYNIYERNSDGVIASNGTVLKKYWNNGSIFFNGPYTPMATNEYGQPISGATCQNVNAGDNPYNYCIKIKKVDATTGDVPKDADGNALTADFTITGEVGAGHGSATVTTDSNGIATFNLGEITPQSKTYNYTIKETRAPEGYATAPDKNVTINSSNDNSYIITKTGSCSAGVTNTTFEDQSYVLNWYKVTENGSTKLPGAKFKVNNGSIKTKGMGSGIYSGCYKYSTSGTNSVFTADSNGAVCIIGLPNGNYTVTETEPGEYHTFGDVIEKSLATAKSIVAMNDSNKFINKPTYVRFHKNVSNTNYAGDGVDGEFTDITTAELKKIDFNVYNSSNQLLSFKYNTTEGVYEYAKDNTLDLPSVSGSVTDLHTNDSRDIILKHLPKGNYRIVEKETKICGNTASTNENCIGYYTPSEATTFTVTHNSSKNGNIYQTNSSMNNTPTEIEFTKADFYGYEDAADVVDFENDKERNDFDKIVFKIKDENGNYLNLRYMGKEGTCLTDNSYSIYRYVPGDNTNVSSDPSTGTELHTCGGHIRITNLCKGKRYIVEEISVPEDSVFVKEQQNGQNPSASYTIPCKEGEVTRETTTNIINDKPTRIRLEKRDLKYGNLINDEKTTFEIYRCPKGQTCNPSNYGTVEERESAGMKLVKFAPRAYLRGDEEDGGTDDFERSYQVYKAMSDSDVQNGTNYETSLHPDHGVLILRYLQAGYNYIALETKAPVGYTLPSGTLAETNFTVINTTVDVEAIKVPNRPSKIIVRKYDTEGKLLTGARFKIYKVNKADYNENIAASLQKKTELALKTIRAGVYEYREIYDTNEFTTCVDTEASKCSSITDTLTDESFANSNLKETIEVKQGEAIIQYLEVDNYYIIEEVKAPDGYDLSKSKEDRFKIVYLPESVEKVDAFTELVNTETTFTFYKFDEYNKLLDGAEFKLQKLNNNKKYEDVTVTETTISDKKVYKVDKDSSNTVITTTEGAATVAYMTKGQYRIVETKAAPGKELPKKTLNVATFFVDDDGSVHGSAIITNKSKTEMIESKPKASAELIVNIQTGQTVIKYTLIIVVLLLIGVGLFITKRKIDKK